MDTKRFPILVKSIYEAVNELEEMFTKDGKKRHFTPDGHMVGSIGEVLAAYHYGIELFPASHEKHDGKVGERYVQVKATQRASISISHPPDFLLVLRISKEGTAEEIYSGPGDTVWDLFKDKRMPKNGQHQVRISRLREMIREVQETDKIKRIRS